MSSIKPYLMYTIAKLKNCLAGAAGHDFTSSIRVVLNIMILIKKNYNYSYVIFKLSVKFLEIGQFSL